MLTGLDNPLLQQQISHLERLLTGLTTRLFDKKTLITTPATPYKLLCADKVIIILSIQSDPLLHTRVNHE
jgi:hypothetical protein